MMICHYIFICAVHSGVDFLPFCTKLQCECILIIWPQLMSSLVCVIF